MAKKKMTEKEKQDWESLYYHVKNVMGYDENQSLSSTMVLRLKGLLTNKFIENSNIAKIGIINFFIIFIIIDLCLRL